MNVRGCWFATALAFVTLEARAEDKPKLDLIDVRAPIRFGFAYTGITRAPEMSLSWGVEADVLRLSRRLTFHLALDFEVNARLDLPDQDPVSSFSGVGLGAGLFYVTEGNVGLGLESTASLVFDANQLVGAGVATRVFVYPFYLPIEDVLKHKQGRMSAWVKSSLSLWAMARADWVGADGRGGTLAFGWAVEVTRLIFLPYIEVLSNKLK